MEREITRCEYFLSNWPYELGKCMMTVERNLPFVPIGSILHFACWLAVTLATDKEDTAFTVYGSSGLLDIITLSIALWPYVLLYVPSIPLKIWAEITLGECTVCPRRSFIKFSLIEINFGSTRNCPYYIADSIGEVVDRKFTWTHIFRMRILKSRKRDRGDLLKSTTSKPFWKETERRGNRKWRKLTSSSVDLRNICVQSLASLL